MNCFVKGNPITCIGCRTCMIGCVVAHEGLEIFQMDPDEYAFNPKLDIVKTATISVAVQCKHCENPACMSVCLSSAIDRIDNAVIIDTNKCIGCKMCMIACPYGAINMLKESKSDKVVANKCDLCAGVEGGPTCVKVCPTKSLTLETEESLETSAKRKRVETALGLSQING